MLTYILFCLIGGLYLAADSGEEMWTALHYTEQTQSASIGIHEHVVWERWWEIGIY